MSETSIMLGEAAQRIFANFVDQGKTSDPKALWRAVEDSGFTFSRGAGGSRRRGVELGGHVFIAVCRR